MSAFLDAITATLVANSDPTEAGGTPRPQARADDVPADAKSPGMTSGQFETGLGAFGAIIGAIAIVFFAPAELLAAAVVFFAIVVLISLAILENVASETILGKPVFGKP